jgi:hypothetical protein
LSIRPPADKSANLIPTFQGSDLAYLRAEVIAMPQKSNDPDNAEPSASVPQEQDDELEMAEDDEDFEDEEDFDSDSELEDEEVEE